jgi:hypothetical protein
MSARTVAALPLVAAGNAAQPNGVDGRAWYGATVAVSVGRSRVLGGALVAAVAVAAFATTFANTLPWCGARYHAFERTVLAAVLLDCLAVQPAAVALAALWRWMSAEDADGAAALRARQHPVVGHTMPDPGDADDVSESDAGKGAMPDDEWCGDAWEPTRVAVAAHRRASYVTYDDDIDDDIALEYDRGCLDELDDVSDGEAPSKPEAGNGVLPDDE